MRKDHDFFISFCHIQFKNNVTTNIGLRDFMDNFLSKHDIFRNRPTSSKAILGHVPLKELLPQFFSIATMPDINLESAQGVHGWHITFRGLLNDWEPEKAVEFSRP